jgi:sec-independent protein translocase protein TatC
MTQESAQPQHEMTFFDHLEELRSRAFKAAGGVILVCIAVAFKVDWIINNILLKPALDNNVQLQNIVPFGQAFLIIKVIFTVGLILSFPWILWQLWSFIAPGLYMHERRWAGRITFFTTLCFMCGVAFGYFLLIPSMMAYVSQTANPNIENNIAVTEFYSFMVNMLLASGLMFELPMITWVLARVGILSHETMVKYRRHSIVGILVVAAVVTPSPDPITQFMVAIPLYILFEISVVLCRMAYTPRSTPA